MQLFALHSRVSSKNSFHFSNVKEDMWTQFPFYWFCPLIFCRSEFIHIVNVTSFSCVERVPFGFSFLLYSSLFGAFTSNLFYLNNVFITLSNKLIKYFGLVICWLLNQSISNHIYTQINLIRVLNKTSNRDKTLFHWC